MSISEKIIQIILNENPLIDVNELHERAYELLKEIEKNKFEKMVDEYIKAFTTDKNEAQLIKRFLLSKNLVKQRNKYSNIIDEIAVSLRQSRQPISGNIAELCAKRELLKYGLKEDFHFVRKEVRSDITLYHPNKIDGKLKHEIEVKNIKLRERATRGLLYGDSLFGFFNDSSEFTEETIKEIEKLCKERNGFCYIPPKTMKNLSYMSTRFRENINFGIDMSQFVKYGYIKPS